MLNACVQRFDVTENVKIFAKFLGTKPGLNTTVVSFIHSFSEIVPLLAFE
jgi:hypothetical protein